MAKAKIMIVEDEILLAMNIKSKLSSLGYEICKLATSGKEAINNAEQEKPDIILMDIVLKGKMDGIEAATQIHSSLNIPIIYLTAYDNKDVLERAKITEPFGYLLKPFVERELHSTIEMALFKHKAEEERERLVSQLKDALSKVKLLSGLIPICASCKKIRDDKGYWEYIELYIRDHSEADFTHSYCPDCFKKVCSDLQEDEE